MSTTVHPAVDSEIIDAIWTLDLVDPEVKLYLLAYAQNPERNAARKMAGLGVFSESSAYGWLRGTHLITPTGEINEQRIKEKRGQKVIVSLLED